MISRDFVLFGIQIALMLACALVFAEILCRFHQPAVVGEMFGGILLGPTLFGAMLPAVYLLLFHPSETGAVVRDASIKLGMLFFLFVAGLEVNLSDLRRHGHRAVMVGLVATLIPIAAGVALIYAVLRSSWGPMPGRHLLAFALFIGIDLANSANPVITRVLMDLGLLHTGIGSLAMTATVPDDLVNGIRVPDLAARGRHPARRSRVEERNLDRICRAMAAASRGSQAGRRECEDSRGRFASGHGRRM